MVTLPGFIAAVAAPLVPMAIGGLDRRLALLGLMGLMGGASILSAVAPSFVTLLASRFLVGLSIGGFWAIAGGLAPRLVPAASVRRATSLIFGGVCRCVCSRYSDWYLDRGICGLAQRVHGPGGKQCSRRRIAGRDPTASAGAGYRRNGPCNPASERSGNFGIACHVAAGCSAICYLHLHQPNCPIPDGNRKHVRRTAPAWLRHCRHRRQLHDRYAGLFQCCNNHGAHQPCACRSDDCDSDNRPAPNRGCPVCSGLGICLWWCVSQSPDMDATGRA